MSASATPRRLSGMSNTAFAGFLRLLLTPLAKVPEPSAELNAYLRYLSRTRREAPLPRA